MKLIHFVEFNFKLTILHGIVTLLGIRDGYTYRYTYLPIRYYHDTWVPIRYVLRFKNFDSTSIAIRYCNVAIFVFNSRPWEKVEILDYTLKIDCI